MGRRLNPYLAVPYHKLVDSERVEFISESRSGAGKNPATRTGGPRSAATGNRGVPISIKGGNTAGTRALCNQGILNKRQNDVTIRTECGSNLAIICYMKSLPGKKAPGTT